MYVLYYEPSTASLAVHWMLLELGAPFELRRVDFAAGAQRSAEYLALNPNGHVPTLLIDGRPYTEVAALLQILAERHPEGGFDTPPGDPARADHLQLLLHLANTLQPAFRAWFYPHEPAGPEQTEAARAAARPRIEAAWARMEARFADGRTYALGDRVRAPDLLLTMLARWSRGMPRPATDHPRLRAYLDRMRARPALREVHRREALTDWIDD